MEKIASLGFVKRVIHKYNFSIKKKLGQNFLINSRILDKIVEAANLSPEDIVVEIGPGLGALTQRLAVEGCTVVAVELDKGILPILTEHMKAYPNVKIINADILELNLDRLVEKTAGENRPYKVVANLPYYITTPIVMGLLEQRFKIESMVIMVQKEVADRMVAGPGKKDYGALSVAVQYYTEASIITKVPPSSFYPAPQVESAVVKLSVRKEPPVRLDDEALFFQVVKGAFGQRRKTLLNALNSYFSNYTKAELQNIFEASGIDGIRRGETLSIKEFASLANSLAKLKDK